MKTSEMIAELERLAEKATKGPWTPCENGAIGNGDIHEEQDEETGQRYAVACQHHIASCDDRADRELITAIRNNLPYLLACAREAEAWRTWNTADMQSGTDTEDPGDPKANNEWTDVEAALPDTGEPT